MYFLLVRKFTKKIYFCSQNFINMKTKHRCIICLGSNTESEYHMNWAEEILSDLFPEMRWGEIVENCPGRYRNDNFLFEPGCCR